MFNWIVSDAMQYFEPFDFVDKIELLEIELFDSLIVCIYKMCSLILYLMYMQKQELALNNSQWLIYHKTKANLWNLLLAGW